MSDDTNSAAATPTTDPKVTIYSTTWCAFCKTEKQWLDRLGVTFAEKDIEEDEAAYNEYSTKTGGQTQGVPVTDVNGTIVLGFDRPKLEAALKESGLVAA